MRLPLVVVCFAVAAAFAAGLVTGLVVRPEADAPEHVHAQAPATAADASQDATASAVSAPRARADDAGSRSAVDDVARRLGAEALAPRGDGVIRGSVRTRNGEGVPDVDVTLWAHPPEAWTADIDSRDEAETTTEERIRHFVREQRWLDSSRRSVRTVADGSYAFTDVADVAHYVQVRSKSMVAHVAEGSDSGDARPGAVVDFVVRPRSGLLLDVTLPDGSAPAQAQVTLRHSNGSRSASWSPSSRQVEAPAGRHRLTVNSGEFEAFASEETEVDVPERIPETALEVRLVARPGIVVDARPAPGYETLPVRIRVTGPDGDRIGEEDPFLHMRHGLRGFDPAGPRPQPFLDLSPGRHVVTATHDGQSLVTADVTVGDGLVRVPLQAPPPDAARLVEVVVSADGAKATGMATFTWRVEGPRSRADYEVFAASRGDQTWHVLRPGPDDRPGSSSRSGGEEDPAQLRTFIGLHLDNVPRATAEVPAGANRVVLRLQEPAWIDVVVDGFAGHRLAKKLHVQAWNVTRGERGGHAATGLGQASVESSGRVRLGPFEPGRIEITLGSERFSGPQLARAVVDARSGAQEAHLALPPLHDVTIELGAKHAGTHVFVSQMAEGDAVRIVGGHFGDSADASGKVVLHNVPPGSYEARLPTETRKFRVPETTVLRLE